MKRSLSFGTLPEVGLVVAGTALIAGTYGLVRLAYGLFLSDIQASLGITPLQAGWISSGASVVYCIGALAGLVADRRPRLLVLAALSTAAVGAAGMALAPRAAAFVPAAIVSSAGAGLASPGLVGVIARSVPEPRRDRAQAVVNSGTGPGLVAAGALALVLLPDWRLGFAIGAVLTAMAGVLVLVLEPARSTDLAAAEPARCLWSGLTVLRTPALGALLLGAASAAVWTYGRAHLLAEGLGTTASTVAWMALGVGGMATVLTASRQARIRPARAWSLTSSGVAVAIAVLGPGAGLLAVAPAACLLFGWAFVAATSGLIAWAAQLVPDRAAAGTATLFIILVLGQAIGSAITGTIADHGGLGLAFLAAAALAVLAAACGQLRVLPGSALSSDRPSTVT
jgi:predicted MFS family arabinose efflux permease